MCIEKNMNIPIYQPTIGKKEKKYVLDCIESTWISSKGKYINKFEKSFSDYTQIPYVSTVSNGTVALHLAMLALGIGKGDEVIMPTLTYVATANAVSYVGAKPVFVDSDPKTWQINPTLIEKMITSKTKAIVVVHLYGQSANMHQIINIAKRNELKIIEDCAEAFGTYYHNHHVGIFSDISTFSFYGNKTITTGEGGMVCTKSEKLHNKMYQLKTQGVSQNKEYFHSIIGYNYRMTNICAAIGFAQIQQAKSFLKKKRNIAIKYNKAFKKIGIKHHCEQNKTIHSYWMYSIQLKNKFQKNSLRNHLKVNGIETRPLFSTHAYATNL